MSAFLNGLMEDTNFVTTENGAISHESTLNKVLDLFSFGGAYRMRTDDYCIVLFKNAYEENADLAIKCLFYLRDVRGGQGERRFFRVAFRWLAKNHTEVARRNFLHISTFGRWDDFIYSCVETPLGNEMIAAIRAQLVLDMNSKTPSLLAKWMPSENASSFETKRIANILRSGLNVTHKEYRKMLSGLRNRIKIVETLMSQNRWDEIEFDKLPSAAGIKYKNAFARRDILSQRYKAFAEDDSTKVNAETLYPLDVVRKCYSTSTSDKTGRRMLQKYWDNLPNYYGERTENAIAVVDVSGSMYCNNNTPIFGAVSMGAYIAEHSKGEFANKFITFSEIPTLVNFEGVDIKDKVDRATKVDWGMSTNLESVFDLLLNTAIKHNVSQEELPERLYIFSDMEFNCALNLDNSNKAETLCDSIAAKWKDYGYELPKVVFWNLNARNNLIPALGDRFSYVSGYSPVMVETILSGKTGFDLMLAKLSEERYSIVGA